DTGPHRPLALEHRTRVDVVTEAGGWKACREPLRERAEERVEPVVVVRTERIRGDATREALAPVVRRARGRAVRPGDHDDGPRPRDEPARIDALGCAPCEVRHLPGATVGEPRGEIRPDRERDEGRAARERGAERAAFAA